MHVLNQAFRENERISENMEQEESKITIEEAFVNLGCVKKELKEEFDFGENRYKVSLTYKNIFGTTSKQRKDSDSLIGFLDDDIIMETETVSIKLEDVKEENENVMHRNLEQFQCNRCSGNYIGYCPNCSSLSHILNNLTPNINSKPDLNSTPINMLEIRHVSRGCAVFALKTLPKGIILGPFEGVAPIESTAGLQWKMKDKKIVNDQNGNWMKYIESVANHSLKNLDVFQIDRILYFETSREIQEGEELLVCYREEKEEMLKSDRKEEFYLVPVKKEEYPTVFACTYCCLGFCLENCLVEHKSKCPQRNQCVNIEGFEIIQCQCCKVWLEKREHLKSHKMHCLDNYNRLYHNLPGFRPITTDGSDEISQIDVDASYSTPSTEIIDSKRSSGIGYEDHKQEQSNISEEEYKYSEYLCETDNPYLKHPNAHNDIKSFECDICKKGFAVSSHLEMHVKDQHSNTIGKEYKCSKCSFQSSYKGNLKAHLNTHNDIKAFECDICGKRFGQRSNLRRHVTRRHSNTVDDIKPFACDICEKRYIQKSNLKTHIQNKHSNTHRDIKIFHCDICQKIFHYKSSMKLHIQNKHSNTHDIKSFECDICKKRFGRKDYLKVHVRNVHSNSSEKEYKCSECSYQTNYKVNLNAHINMHNNIKPFECDICKKRFTQKSHLKGHILRRHLNTHNDIKLFECDLCEKRFSHRSSLKMHIINRHSNTTEKKYKCSDCSYQTNYTNNLKQHLNTHNNINLFECDICKKRFARKDSLKLHTQNEHSNTSVKQYNCSKCLYQTNSKRSLKLHLNVHNNIKPFECDICKQGFCRIENLKLHIRNQHSNTSEKEYKCSECPYQSNRKEQLKLHLNTHRDIKPFECDICKKGYSGKPNLQRHIKNKHSNTSEKDHKCPECPYQTNRKEYMKIHVNTHSDIKSFECDICKKKFTQNSSLKLHVRNQHRNTNEKEYKCSECSYQTNYKGHFKQHLNTHTDIKPFECNISST